MSGVDWSNVPERVTGAMVAQWGHPKGLGHVEYLGPAIGKPRACYDEGPNSWLYVARPVEWNGEGLPPVGTVCEFQHRNAPNGVWYPTTIRYSSHAFIVYVDNIHGCEECWAVNDGCAVDFRPIRTAEQIAAAEAEAALYIDLTESCAEAWPFGDTAEAHRKIAAKLVEKGWRK